MIENTKAPWKMERIGGNYHNSRETGMAFRIVAPEANSNQRWDVAVVYYKPDFEEAEANAKVLTAAPVMKDALIRVRAWCEDLPSDVVQDVLDAIRQAGG